MTAPSHLEQLRQESARRLKDGKTAMEVLHWLKKEQALAGKPAAELVRAADRMRRTQVRRESARGILVSVPLLLMAAGAAVAIWKFQHRPSKLLLGCVLLAIASSAWLVRCAVRLVTAGREEAIVWEV